MSSAHTNRHVRRAGTRSGRKHCVGACCPPRRETACVAVRAVLALAWRVSRLFVSLGLGLGLALAAHRNVERFCSHDIKTLPCQLRRLFCVLSRYETLSATSDGYQMAFP
ncbi:unnamed protein product, partial [Ectocarpus sp. 13 AM-2016]